MEYRCSAEGFLRESVDKVDSIGFQEGATGFR